MIIIKNVEHTNGDEQHYLMQTYGAIDFVKSGIGCATSVTTNRSILYVFIIYFFTYYLAKLIYIPDI